MPTTSVNNHHNVVVSIIGTNTLKKQYESIIRAAMIDDDTFVIRGDGAHALTTITNSLVESLIERVFALGGKHAIEDHIKTASLNLFKRYEPDESVEYISNDIAVTYVESVSTTMHGTPSFSDINIVRGIYLCVMGIIRQIIQNCCVEILEKRYYITKVPRTLNASIYNHMKEKYTDKGLDFRRFLTPPIATAHYTRYVTIGFLLDVIDMMQLPRPRLLDNKSYSQSLGEGGWVPLNSLSCDDDIQLELYQYSVVPTLILQELLGNHPVNPNEDTIQMMEESNEEGDDHSMDSDKLTLEHEYSDCDSDYHASQESESDNDLDLNLSKYTDIDNDDSMKEDDSSHESDNDVSQW